MSRKLNSSTVAFASAILLVAGAGYSQPRGSEQVQQASGNFYITTPQTGEQVSAGGTQAVVSSAAAGSQSTLNTYTGTRSWQSSQATGQNSTADRSSRTSGRQSTSRNSKSQAQAASAQYYTAAASNQATAQLASANYNTYYQSNSNQPTAQQTVYPSYVAHASAQPTTQEKKGMLSRLLHRDSSSKAQVQQVSNNIQTSKYTGTVQSGSASWYGSDFHGGKTANGERYNMESMTAAHRTLPFGTLVKVKNERNGRECVVRINNRGPFIKGRILDVSKAAARQLGMVSSGVAKIKMEVVGRS